MSKLQVLVTTMHQTGFDKFYEMNLQTDAILANPAEDNFTKEESAGTSRVKLVTTDTRGLSKNRNIAIKNISEDAEYIMFSDDDLIFYDNYEDIIVSEFEKCPEADAIKFNIKAVSERQLSMKKISELKKLSRRDVTPFGVLGLVIKKDVFLKNKIRFNERFGTGTPNFCGEDSIFYQQLLKQKVVLFGSPLYIADIDQSDSTWFRGHDEKYFTVAGMIINECYPILSFVLVIRSAIKAYKRKDSKLCFLKILGCYYKGAFYNIFEKAALKRRQ